MFNDFNITLPPPICGLLIFKKWSLLINYSIEYAILHNELGPFSSV
jgi:hypothetical protein